MGSPTTGRQVVLSIHPQFAEAIMDGRKLVEFRKRPLANDVTIVWVYATAPVQRVIGYFEVDRTVTAAPHVLWRRFSKVGCIERIALRSLLRGLPCWRRHRYQISRST
ncbi:hypothetical protein GCM10009856_32440 [Mycolicibacterium llatzerense]